ncbi:MULTISPECIES: hypothetical protein [Providencia]|uniref:hypothetical protein n=1 Tax=Providencia TaxID=586 RepID=UPI001CA5FF82|nr:MULTISPECIES: hypothetical protein [Providencia]QZY64943.1 hypothetical protein K7H99_02480 [Providencia rettgeri]
MKLEFKSVTVLPETDKSLNLPNAIVSMYMNNDDGCSDELEIRFYIDGVENKTIREIHKEAEDKFTERLKLLHK